MSNSNQKPQLITDIDSLCTAITVLEKASQFEGRKLIAIAGPPGSGKSTLLAQLLPLLKQALGEDQVTGLPMDGYHLDNAQLDADGTRSVKGAPHTFDVRGLLSLIVRLSTNENPIFAPEFDRDSDLSRNCAIKVGQSHKLVLIEGNYLLLDQPVWCELAPHFAVTISIDVPMGILQDRLVQRWLHHGMSVEDANRKALSNDIPNAKTVVEQSISPDIVYKPENVT